MKAAIVKSSALLSNAPGCTYSRWDAGFWLGEIDDQRGAAAIAHAQERARQALARVEKLQAEQAAAQARAAALVAAGVVVPIQTSEEQDHARVT